MCVRELLQKQVPEMIEMLFFLETKGCDIINKLQIIGGSIVDLCFFTQSDTFPQLVTFQKVTEILATMYIKWLSINGY